MKKDAKNVIHRCKHRILPEHINAVVACPCCFFFQQPEPDGEVVGGEVKVTDGEVTFGSKESKETYSPREEDLFPIKDGDEVPLLYLARFAQALSFFCVRGRTYWYAVLEMSLHNR